MYLNTGSPLGGTVGKVMEPLGGVGLVRWRKCVTGNRHSRFIAHPTLDALPYICETFATLMARLPPLLLLFLPWSFTGLPCHGDLPLWIHKLNQAIFFLSSKLPLMVIFYCSNRTHTSQTGRRKGREQIHRQLLKQGAQYFRDLHLKSRLSGAAHTPWTVCKGDRECAPPADQGLQPPTSTIP